MKEVQITREEWLAEFERITATAGIADDDWLTAKEIEKQTGYPLFRVHEYLNALNDLGRLLISHKPVPKLGGRTYKAPCYRIVANKENSGD